MRGAGGRFLAGMIAAGRLLGAAHDFPSPSQVRYDANCLTLNGQDVLIDSVECQYAPEGRGQWAERLAAIKAGGFNAVTAAVSDPAGLGDWLKLAHDRFGLYTLIRPSARNLAATASVVAAGQISRRPGGRGGTVLVEVPRGAALKTEYVAWLAAGVDIPVFALNAPECRDSDDPVLGHIFDALAIGPAVGFEERVSQMTALVSAQPDALVLLDQAEPAATSALELAQAVNALQEGATVLSLGWSNPAAPEAVRLNRMLAQYGPELARTHPLTIQTQTGNDDVTLVVRRSRNGATFLFLANRSPAAGKRGRASLWLDKDGVEIGVDYVLPPLTAKVMRLPPHSTDTAQVAQLLGE